MMNSIKEECRIYRIRIESSSSNKDRLISRLCFLCSRDFQRLICTRQSTFTIIQDLKYTIFCYNFIKNRNYKLL